MLRKQPAPPSRRVLAVLMLMMLSGYAEHMQADSVPAEDIASNIEIAQNDDSDWDWSGITAEDSTPAEATTQAVNPQPTSTRDVTTAEPDYAATPGPALAIFANAPEFDVIPSKKNPEMHPCTNCHQWTRGDTNPRKLKAPHDDFELKHGLHGKGKFWCMTCHNEDISRGLVTLEGEKVDYNDAYVICSQCHSHQARDWVYGAHGKRVGNWQGKRQILNCTACHYQHSPAVKPRAPLAGPVVRMGLERPSHWKSQQHTAGHNENALLAPPNSLSYSKVDRDE